ncbi:predicted protein [Naegleria gruberi]|uniref:Predicted protein n=1 Tax=Naegleria gruberi TaxID=5762 RepID=D2VHI8_NAEGR|nr:uncharacterized protein NAEGRDRAFT_49590 [Naegleria gruberi]EFC43689.1 predicted protein [Naegleria gruberi]|eukprot:XP_002676433.1 predicted protein [Naegleria gruberi strain NEG-M]
MSNVVRNEKTSTSALKKVRIRRQLVIPNLLKNYFVLSVNSSSAQPATHQHDDTCKPSLNDGQFSVYRVCGDENIESGAFVGSDPSKRASVLAKRADVKENVKRKAAVKKHSACSSSLEFINTACSPDCLSFNNSKIGKSKKMRIHSPDFSNSYSNHDDSIVGACNTSSECGLSNNTPTNFSNSIQQDEANLLETFQTNSFTSFHNVSSTTKLNLTKQHAPIPPIHPQEQHFHTKHHLQ